jgi:DNA-binding protein HU-beta
MTRKDLIDKIAEEFGIRKKDAEAVVKFLFREITEALKRGERVSIQGFGVFDLKEQKERKIKNPRTGELIKVPRKKKVYFRPTFKL